MMKTKEAIQKNITTLGATAFRFKILLEDIEEYYSGGNRKDGRDVCKTLKKMIDTLEVIRCELATECGYQSRSPRALYHVSGDGDTQISKNIRVKDLAYLDIDMLQISNRLKETIIIIDDLCSEQGIDFFITAGYIPSNIQSSINLSSHSCGRAIDIIVCIDNEAFIKIVSDRLYNKGIKGKIINRGQFVHIECYRASTSAVDFLIAIAAHSKYLNCANKKKGFEYLIPIAANKGRTT